MNLNEHSAFAPDASDRIQTGLVNLDAQGGVTFANRAAREFLGEEALASSGLAPLALGAADAGPRAVHFRGRDLTVHLHSHGEGWIVEINAREATPADYGRCTLTGLSDRRTFRERLASLLAGVRRGREPFALLCIDLDRFKAVNDSLGHPIGDALLRKVGERLVKAAREEDVIARLGGDEFAIIQMGADQPHAAEALAERIVDLIGRTYVVEGHMLNIGASVGVAIAPGDGDDADTLMKRADMALYRAKADGRGVFRFFEAGMDARMQTRRALEIDLRRALALKEFELAYQPQVRSSDGAVTGFEALLRWRHPERGTVSPADFIPLAEEIGLITPIGEWVLRTACAQAATWPEEISLAVNVSPVQFRGAKLIDTVTSALARSGLAASRLELEITEGTLLDNTDVVLNMLNSLRDLGVRISMDDFGTGYSSLSYLQKFPFTKIKIDQSFVRRMNDSPDCSAIVRAVTSLGASLGMKTTAEGVETEAQRDRIRAEGCTEIQGYLTGRPMNAEAAIAFIAAHPQQEP